MKSTPLRRRVDFFSKAFSSSLSVLVLSLRAFMTPRSAALNRALVFALN
jgi:hypothetical protein